MGGRSIGNRPLPGRSRLFRPRLLHSRSFRNHFVGANDFSSKRRALTVPKTSHLGIREWAFNTSAITRGRTRSVPNSFRKPPRGEVIVNVTQLCAIVLKIRAETIIAMTTLFRALEIHALDRAGNFTQITYEWISCLKTLLLLPLGKPVKTFFRTRKLSDSIGVRFVVRIVPNSRLKFYCTSTKHVQPFGF